MSDIDLEKIRMTIEDAAYGLSDVIDRTKSAVMNPKWRPPKLYVKPQKEKNKGLARTILGYGMVGVGGAVLATAILATGVAGIVGGGLLIGAGMPIGISGSMQLSRVERFKEYVRALGSKTFITLENLAEFTGKSLKYVRNDVEDMIDRKMFVQGHLDTEQGNLLVSDEAYANYRHMLEMKEQEQEVEKQKEDLLKESGLTTEGRSIVRQGTEYLERIQRINAELPGAVITEKLQKLEMVIARILDEVKKQPDKATDLRKLMNYYLPTTWKLLESYKEIDEEPVKTEQMESTQKEIEGTLDTINNAFVNLLEQIFQNKAWDISTDIKVLNTMFVQEGLADSDFNMKKNKEIPQ